MFLTDDTGGSLRVTGNALPRAARTRGPASRQMRQPALTRLLRELPADRTRLLYTAARQNGTSTAREAIAGGFLKDTRVYQAIARDMGLPFVGGPLDPRRLILDESVSRIALRRPVPVLYRNDSQELALAIAPEVYRFEAMRRYRKKYPGIAKRMVVTSSAALRRALMTRLSGAIADRASFRLMRDMPAMSARHGLSAWQGAAVASLAMALPLGLAITPSATLILAHVLATTFFLSCIGLRLCALRAWTPVAVAVDDQLDTTGLPVCTVLVACYREAPMAGQIVAALRALRWPAAKLEVKLVCEADDLETIDAFRARDLPATFEILEVPVRGPRTKPKALDFALHCSSGEMVTVFDAEDRPHPDQLLEAWRALDAGDEQLACVQAPLDIANGGNSWLARMFELEYAALFRGVLPYLAARGRLLPLGGTSNHFRRSVLEDVGGWDPYNVTEDADLSVRLMRHGYRCGMISTMTREDAPERLRDWLPQRTRWFKGWMQTWIVHMRNPGRTRAQLGRRDFWLMQILFAGAIGSALVHPLMLGFVAWTLLAGGRPFGMDMLPAVLTSVDVASIVLGYVAFHLLAMQVASPGGLWHRLASLVTLPAYWVLHSAAAWRAVWQLYRDPFRWEKTDHAPARD